MERHALDWEREERKQQEMLGGKWPPSGQRLVLL